MSEQAGPLHPVLATLGSQFIRELNLFAVFGLDRYADTTQRESIIHGLGYLAGRAVTLSGILDILDSAEAHLERERFANFVDLATLPDGVEVGDYLGADSELVAPGAAANALVGRWIHVLRDDQPPAFEWFLLFHDAARLTSQQGYAAGVTYVLDLLDAGHVLQPDVAGSVIAALVVAAGRDLPLEQFTAALWEEKHQGDWWSAVADRQWTEPTTMTAPMAPLISAVLERCLAAKAAVLAATSHDHWLIELHRFRRLGETAHGMVRSALENPSLTTRTILSQLEENRADIAVIAALEEGHSFHRVVDEVERLTGEMAGAVRPEDAPSRYRAERQLIPDALRRRPTPNDWFTPTWRIASPLWAWRTGEEGPSPFIRGGPNEDFFGLPLSDQEYVLSKLAEISDELDAGNYVGRALPLATRLVYDFPWCDIAYWKASECYYQLGHFGYLDAAIDFLIPTLALQPLQPKIWESLALCLEGSGESSSAGVVRDIAQFVESDQQAISGESTDDEVEGAG